MALILLLASLLTPVHADDKKTLYTERVVCSAYKEEGHVPLALIEGESVPEFSLDLDKAKSDLANGTAKQKYSIPGVEARVWYSLRYFPATNEKVEHIEVSSVFFKKQKLAPPSKKKGKKMAEPSKEAETNTWQMIPVMSLPGEISFPMIPEQINSFSSPEFDIVPPLEIECKLKREKIKQDCPTCK